MQVGARSHEKYCCWPSDEFPDISVPFGLYPIASRRYRGRHECARNCHGGPRGDQGDPCRPTTTYGLQNLAQPRFRERFLISDYHIAENFEPGISSTTSNGPYWAARESQYIHLYRRSRGGILYKGRGQILLTVPTQIILAILCMVVSGSHLAS